ncbi:MAG TPA: hypothetical protein DEB39_17070 [Planctomycetaceae bacterium]|nr:hypothetical protein [Planctomycetaceae bacterium]
MLFHSTHTLLSGSDILERLLCNHRMSILVIDVEARVTLIGGKLLELVDYSSADCLGKTVDELFSFDPGIAVYYRRALQGVADKLIVINERNQVEIHFEPIRNDEGHLVGALGYDLVLADRERLLQAQQERERQLAELLDNSIDGVLLLDCRYVIKRSNAVVEKMYNDGRPLAGHICYQRIRGRSKICKQCPVAEVFRTKTAVTAQFFDEGLKRYIAVHAAPLFDDRGEEVIGALETLRDVTQVIEYAHQIKSQELLVNDIFSSIRDSVFIINSDFTILRANPAFEALRGCGLPLAGRKCYEITGLDGPCPYCEVYKVFTNREAVVFVHQQPEDDAFLPGQWQEHSCHPVVSEDGDVTAAVCIIRDITDRKADEEAQERHRNELEMKVRERTRELKKSESTMQAILLNSNVPILFTDPAQRIVFVNSALLEIMGYEEKDLLGNDVVMLYPNKIKRYRNFEILRKRIVSGRLEKYRTITQLLRKDGGLIDVDLNIASVFDEHGNVMALVMAVLDITKTLQTLEALKMARQQAEEASIAKSQFLATMSHEIRTPLNGVIGLTDLLLHSDLDDRQRNYAQLAQASGTYLLTLINDILDFSKIEAGKLEIIDAPFDLIEMVESVLGILAAKAQDSHLELCGLFLSGLPRHVVGDGDRIRQILVNFIGNAVKFTSKGGVKLVVAVETWFDVDKKSYCMVRFEVSDTGIGVPEESAHRLFHSFSQVDASHMKKYGGTGLGLAISKELVQLMGGDIGHRTNEHGGSTFWFTVPLQAEQDAETVENVLRHGSLEFKDIPVLVVDDNIVLNDVLRHQLNEWGMLVAIARNKAEALAMLKCAHADARPFRLVIIDNDLEGSPGIELAEEIASCDDFLAIGMILLTPLSNEFEGPSIPLRYVDKIIGKPLTGSTLFNSVLSVLTDKVIVGADRTDLLQTMKQTWVKERTFQKILDDFSVERDVDDMAAETCDDGTPVILIAEDNRVNQIVVSEILAQAGFRYEIAGHGEKVCEAVAARVFSLVLMDCQMPIMDGFQATDMIRRMERGQETRSPAHRGRIPIIALTANATDGDESRCFLSGMDDYCSKPIHAEKLISVIRKWLPTIG